MKHTQTTGPLWLLALHELSYAVTEQVFFVLFHTPFFPPLTGGLPVLRGASVLSTERSVDLGRFRLQFGLNTSAFIAAFTSRAL